jgi:2-oxopent-4-enoate hydratase
MAVWLDTRWNDLGGHDMGVTEAGARLAAARADGVPCAPVRDLLGRDDVVAAYAVQSAWVAERVAAGAQVVGRKIGLTHPAVRAQFDVDEPDFGFLLDDMAYASGELIDVTRLLQPRAEAEIAFVLGAGLDVDGIGPAEVAAATAHVVAALEIVDSRIAGWDITIVDTVADNASSGVFVLGADTVPLSGLDLPTCAMTMWRHDDVVSEGAGADCMGDPLHAVAWLARTARELGAPLRAGDVVLSGALGPVVPIVAGDVFRAEITGIGAVSAEFRSGQA